MFLLLLNVLPCDPDGLAPGSVHTATLKNFFSKKSEYSSGKTLLGSLRSTRSQKFPAAIRLSKYHISAAINAPAQHLVHRCFSGESNHNIYPAKKVSPL